MDGPGAAMINPHCLALNWSKEQRNADRRDYPEVDLRDAVPHSDLPIEAFSIASWLYHRGFSLSVILLVNP